MNVKKIFWHFLSGAAFSPSDLTPTLYIDAINGAYVSTVDNNGTRAKGNIIDSATAETGQALANAGTLASKAIYNGEGWYFKTGAQFTTGAASTYNFIHNGSDFDIFISYYQCPAAAGNIRALLNNNGFSNTARGILLYYDNTGSTNTLKLRIGNGTSSVISRDAAGAITQNAVNNIRVNKSGDTVTLYVNTVQVATQTNTGWSASDAAAVLSICSTTVASVNVWLKDLVFFDRSLTSTEATQMNNRSLPSITPTDINTDVLWGDSNAVGQAPNTGIAPELEGTHNVLMFKEATGSIVASDYVEKLQLAVNQVRTNQTLTLHGIEMRYGYSFADQSFTRAVMKFSEGSTDATAWTSPNLQYTRIMTCIDEWMNEIYHVHRRKPKLRGIIHVHGANDVQAGDGTNYKTAITALVKAIIDKWNSHAVNFEASVYCRLVVFRSKTGTSGYDPTAGALTRGAQEDIGEGSVSVDEPSIAAYIAGQTWFDTDSRGTLDGTHYNDAAYEAMAAEAYNYLVQYINE